MKKSIFLLMNLMSVLALANSVSIPTEVFTELQKFRGRDGQALSADTIRQLPDRVHEMVLSRQEAFYQNLKGHCQDSFQVTFGPQVLQSSDSATKDFQSGMIRVEASKCYANANPQELVRISALPEFKKRAFSTLIYTPTMPQANTYCESTWVRSIGKSRYCYTDFELEKSDASVSQVNFMVLNDDGGQYDAPVYYREAFVSARQMGSQTLYYVLSYVRAKELSSFQKFFAKDYMAKSQDQVFTELGKAISQSRNSGGGQP
jgi:hypothetical protein